MKFAIQKNGRLTQPSIDFLSGYGYNIGQRDHPRHDFINSGSDTFVFLKYADILPAVTNKIVDFGIIGFDTVEDSDKLVVKYEHLGIAWCKVVLAVKRNSQYHKVEDLNGKIIASKFPLITKKYLDRAGIKASVYLVNGSCEVFSHLNYADGIIDIVETGTSLASYNMKPIDKILDIDAILIYTDSGITPNFFKPI